MIYSRNLTLSLSYRLPAAITTSQPDILTPKSFYKQSPIMDLQREQSENINQQLRSFMSASGASLDPVNK